MAFYWIYVVEAAMILHAFMMFLYGIDYAKMYQLPKAEDQMRARILCDLLQTPPSKRFERILDLCFFLVSNENEKEMLHLPNEVLSEIYQHLEKRIRRERLLEEEPKRFMVLTEKEFKRYKSSESSWDSGSTEEILKSWDIPTVERPMGLEKEIERVQKRIKDHKNSKEDTDKEGVGEMLSGEASLTRMEMSDNVDLEKGL
ncbi:daea444e-5cff-4357-96e5-4c0edaa53f1a [Sclerotinia trifoliorum]|uniref:Daea444e-5cff-4357-96e5-4c0edaa53f1a n=1 Tax=Sclerotinia trifoliorum TaxID=28548 RepID=A0A8H2VU13_9HELO|nr:daea444e-5cff-4357-96e5-4c0edaa53f1a [Sclerotinia trifoliorum]